MSRAVVRISNELDRRKVATWASNVRAGTTVEFRAPRRSNDQNALMWSLLTQISQQVEWFGKFRSPEDWKDLITAGLAKHQRIAQGLEGGVVMLGSRTSRMSKQELAELIEYIYATGADRGVVWDEATEYLDDQNHGRWADDE